MSDRRVMAAVRESIANHEKEIGRLLLQQDHVKDMMTAPGITSHGLMSLTITYSTADSQIGRHRTQIRNLRLETEQQ